MEVEMKVRRYQLEAKLKGTWRVVSRILCPTNGIQALIHRYGPNPRARIRFIRSDEAERIDWEADYLYIPNYGFLTRVESA